MYIYWNSHSQNPKPKGGDLKINVCSLRSFISIHDKKSGSLLVSHKRRKMGKPQTSKQKIKISIFCPTPSKLYGYYNATTWLNVSNVGFSKYLAISFYFCWLQMLLCLWVFPYILLFKNKKYHPTLPLWSKKNLSIVFQLTLLYLPWSEISSKNCRPGFSNHRT